MSSFPLAAVAATILSLPPAQVPAAVVQALHAAAPALTDRIDVLSYRAARRAGCTADGAEVVGGLNGSGQVMVRLLGISRNGLACEGWATVELRLFGSLWVTSRPVAAGAPLAGAVRQVEREIIRGFPLFPVRLLVRLLAVDNRPARVHHGHVIRVVHFRMGAQAVELEDIFAQHRPVVRGIKHLQVGRIAQQITAFAVLAKDRVRHRIDQFAQKKALIAKLLGHRQFDGFIRCFRRLRQVG